jgi:hypothetical protein
MEMRRDPYDHCRLPYWEARSRQHGEDRMFLPVVTILFFFLRLTLDCAPISFPVTNYIILPVLGSWR